MTNENPIQNNPYVDSFPRGSSISPYAPPQSKTHFIKRTTKNAQKLVLLPEEGRQELNETNLPEPTLPSVAETSGKANRGDLPRVTSYCCSEALKLDTIATYLKDFHGVNAGLSQHNFAVLYDECLLATYEISTKHAVLGFEDSRPYKKMTVTPAQSTNASTRQGSSVGNHQDIPRVNSFDLGSLSFPTWMLRSEIFFFDYGVIGISLLTISVLELCQR